MIGRSRIPIPDEMPDASVLLKQMDRYGSKRRAFRPTADRQTVSLGLSALIAEPYARWSTSPCLRGCASASWQAWYGATYIRTRSRSTAVTAGAIGTSRNRTPAIRDNNVLVRHIRPAARKLGIEWVHWQVPRRSSATWLQQAGVDVQDAQGLLRHSRASTTQDIYQQLVPASQRRAVERLTALVETAHAVQ
jgi:hypothetical protein